MALLTRNFQGSEQILPPAGGSIGFSFEARTTGSPSRLRARIWISNAEPYTFSPAGPDPRQIFIPSATGLATVTKSFQPFSTSTRIVGPADDTRAQPLQVNFEILGFNAGGGRVGAPVNDRWLITIATLTLTLGAVKSHLGLTHASLSQTLGVSQSTTQRVVTGSNSPEVSAALAKILGGQ